MKYFSNIHNAEELRKAYREHVINMHPDRGGNEEDFKAMQAEFETLKKQYQSGTRFEQYAHRETAEERARREAEEQREREEWARWEAEEKERREREEAEKRERIRKAQEKTREAVRQWAARLERVATDETGKKARYYRFEDKKAAAAFVATTKRNIKAVINHYYPGLKVKVSISGEIWKEKFIISWEDGPGVNELRETVKELRYFIPAAYESAGPAEDYGHYEENDSTAPWREAYGQALGDIDDYTTERTLSDEGREQAEQMAARIIKEWDATKKDGNVKVSLTEFCNLREALGFERLNDRRMYWSTYASNERREDGQDVADMYRESLRRAIYENAPVSVTEKQKEARKAAEFTPRYGKALKSLLQLTGVGSKDDGKEIVFWWRESLGYRKWNDYRLTIAEAVARLEQGETVYFGTAYTYDDPTRNWFAGKYQGGYKVQKTRAEKWAAAGLTLGQAGHNSPNSYLYITGISQEFAAAIRADLADIEKQREQWEQAQQDGHKAETADKPTDSKQDSQKATTSDEKPANVSETTDSNEAPADGLTLEEVDGVLCVIGNSHTTFKNRKQIKAHGATWNKAAQRWEATTDEARETLRRWFAMRETSAQAEEPTTANETTEAPTLEDSREISALLEAVADLFRTLSDIMQQAKRWEGVTVPAATLERWKQEAQDGTKTAAARLCEVCACLGSLTPESRKDFDALGVIFWTLSEQLKQGADPATIGTATDFARAQLYDLISRTQNENQARAVREANDPTAAPADPFREAA